MGRRTSDPMKPPFSSYQWRSYRVVAWIDRTSPIAVAMKRPLYIGSPGRKPYDRNTATVLWNARRSLLLDRVPAHRDDTIFALSRFIDWAISWRYST